ncbi:hypothetical protein RHMOL_Rhmol01G0080500 [Rhododendron molle]|uniref:Uncharacterized protein n=1 Tax=Rhododendron molle TaxID=49168 RepID=A0ACC0Q0L7_RHOML|nr:hypothetical protein RHMOL_Rhmol01G0080500 [Rhododendron molle]
MVAHWRVTAPPPSLPPSVAPATEVPLDAVVGAAKSEALPLREASEKSVKPGPTDNTSVAHATGVPSDISVAHLGFVFC